ncbi:MAG: hypothetical protein KF746_05415 [Chitinophagaceae bacterium]|nr:hypothetical protein [Chitinophagaceae bacterium]
MKLTLLLTVILLSSCEAKKETIVNRQQAIKEEMEQIKKAYYKKEDSLNIIKQTDTNSAKRLEIAEEFVSDGKKKSVILTKLQLEYDSLEVELMKY